MEGIPERAMRTLNFVREKWDPEFEFIRPEWTPWTPLVRAPGECRVALVSTGGLYVRGEQEPFDDAHPHGDNGFREIPANITYDRLAIAHSHYDHRYALEDLNVVFPLERFRDLVGEGVVGELAPTHYSFMGYITRPYLLLVESAPRVATQMREEGVDLAFLNPV